MLEFSPLFVLSDSTMPYNISFGAVFILLACSLSLTVTTVAMPSMVQFSNDTGSVSSVHDMLDARSDPLEIRGVYGGRHKRYILERADAGSCSRECKEKPICLPTFGEIIKDCKCQKCPTGVPALGGDSCQDTCPEGTVTLLDRARVR